MPAFLVAWERSYFFFGDDVQSYLKSLYDDILTVKAADASSDERVINNRWAAFGRIGEFNKIGRPLIGKYMRFAQQVPAESQWKPLGPQTQQKGARRL
jgi:hypothetical protein